MYCSEIWGNAYKTNIQCIVIVQKRVVRLIHGANRLDHIDILFYNYRILKFVDIVEFKTVLFMHNAYYNFDKMMEKCISLRSSRGTHQFARENARTDMQKTALPVCGVQLFSSLDTNVVSIMPQYVFKREYKDTLLQRYAI